MRTMLTLLPALALLLGSGCDILFPEPLADDDKDGFTEDIDCDDADDAVNPAIAEICDGIDNDCDGEVDEPGSLDAGTWYYDADGDDYGDPAVATVTCEAPEAHVSDEAGLDCDDTDASIHPMAEESCNGLDDDCDGSVDEDAADADTWYLDSDGDGYGADDVWVVRCEEVSGYILQPGDCDDGWVEVNPDAEESCNGLDDDCDGLTDEDDALDASTWYLDADGDGYGLEDDTTTACWQPSAYAAEYGDCDDDSASVSPGATEICNGVDDDCDDEIDEDDAADATTWYLDADGDGYVTDDTSITTCDQPSGYADQGEDCDDTRADVNPDGAEVCDDDDADEDCDGMVDDLDSSLDSGSLLSFYRDDDGDGYGGSDRVIQLCDAPSGYIASSAGEDCDDDDSHVNPGATEVCDTSNTDEDCDGLVNTDDPSVDADTFVSWYADLDEDGYGDHDNSQESCDAPSGYLADDTDCDDSDATINPAGQEICDDDDDDEDCDGRSDEADRSTSTDTISTWYSDADGDGYGDLASPTSVCDQPSGTVEDATDCDDGDATINPAGQEICDDDDVDEDCDGRSDDGDRSTSTDTMLSYYEDVDGDGYGDAASSLDRCDAPSGYVAAGTDCDDDDAASNPAASEVCDDDDDDEDCDGLADDDDSSADSSTMTTWYADLDGDGFGDLGSPAGACDAPESYVADDSDCDDSASTSYPGATEVCNYTDDDCDGDTDEAVTVTYWQDVDLDGEGGAALSDEFCEDEPSSGWSAENTDCDDYDAFVHSGAVELCDGQQNDCDDSSWSSTDEEETISHESSSGLWSDLTDDWGDGSPSSPVAVTLPNEGSVHVCPGNWYVLVTAASGSEVSVVGRYGYADTALNGSSGGSVLSLEDATVSVSLQELTIEEGQAAQGAGVNSSGGTVTVADCLFRYNYLDSSGSAYGAGIYAEAGSVQLSGTTFRSNGVYSAGSSYGGAIATSNADLTLDDCSLENNEADNGGGVRWTASGSASLSITDTSFDGNETSDEDGGALHISTTGSGDISISDSSFEDNAADGDGGAIFFESEGSASLGLSDSSFEYNRADEDGGALYLSALAGGGSLSGLEVTGNEATRGGGLCTHEGVVLDDSTFADNSSDSGAALAGLGGDLELSSVSITGNEAQLLGGGVLVQGADLYCTACSIDDNEVPASAGNCYGGTYDDPYCAGAGIYASDADIWLEGSSVTGNLQHTSQDTFGGGIYLDGGELVITGASEISGNEAEYGAGVLAYGASSSTSVSLDGDSEITGNVGDYYAGVFLDTATLSCTGSASDDTGITAHSDGGGLYVHYEHGPSIIVEAEYCDFGSSGGFSDNFDDGNADRDVYLAGVGWTAYGDDASFLCDETGCY